MLFASKYLFCSGVVRFSAIWSVTVLSASRNLCLSWCCPLLEVLVCYGCPLLEFFCHGVAALSLLGVLVCQGIVRFYGFGVSRRCPLLVVLVCDSVVRFLGFGPSRCCPLLGVLVCHGVVHFWGFWFVTVLSASGALGLSGCCLGPFLGNLVSVSVCRGISGFGLSRHCPLLGVLVMYRPCLGVLVSHILVVRF